MCLILAYGRRWARRGAGVDRSRVRLVLGSMPGSWSRARVNGGQIRSYLGCPSLLLLLLRSELAAEKETTVSFNKVLVVYRSKIYEILDVELLLAGRGGEEEGRWVEGCSSVELLLDGRGGEGEKLYWASSTASTVWRSGGSGGSRCSGGSLLSRHRGGGGGDVEARTVRVCSLHPQQGSLQASRRRFLMAPLSPCLMAEGRPLHPWRISTAPLSPSFWAVGLPLHPETALARRL
jgi:hypothetical protein